MPSKNKPLESRTAFNERTAYKRDLTLENALFDSSPIRDAAEVGNPVGPNFITEGLTVTGRKGTGGHRGLSRIDKENDGWFLRQADIAREEEEDRKRAKIPDLAKIRAERAAFAAFLTRPATVTPPVAVQSLRPNRYSSK